MQRSSAFILELVDTHMLICYIWKQQMKISQYISKQYSRGQT